MDFYKDYYSRNLKQFQQLSTESEVNIPSSLQNYLFLVRLEQFLREVTEMRKAGVLQRYVVSQAQTARRQRERKEAFEKLINFLQSNGGVVRLSEARIIVSGKTLLRLVAENRETLQILKLRYRGGQGRTKTFPGSHFAKAEYLGKYFIALKDEDNRTGIVRFFIKILKEKIEGEKYSQHEVKAITQWLKNFGLTRAEIGGVVTKLGYRYKTLRHMRIDGILDRKPMRLRKGAGRRSIKSLNSSSGPQGHFLLKTVEIC